MAMRNAIGVMREREKISERIPFAAEERVAAVWILNGRDSARIAQRQRVLTVGSPALYHEARKSPTRGGLPGCHDLKKRVSSAGVCVLNSPGS